MQKKERSGPPPEPDKIMRRPKPQKRRRGLGLATALSLLIAFVVFFVLTLALSGRTILVPEFLRAKLEESLNEQIEGAPLRLGQIELGVDRRGVPQVLVTDIGLADQTGGVVAQLNWLGAELSLERLVRRQFAAKKVYLTGAQITIRRTAAGRFTLAAGNAMGGSEQSIVDFLAQMDRTMSEGALSSLSEVVAAGVVLTLEDARSGRIWQATNASATLRTSADGLSLSVTSDVFNGTDALAGLQLSLSRSRATGHVQLGARVTDMQAGDIASQSPVLAWLGVLDAPISGAVRTELDETGALSSFAGTLDMSGGALQPNENIPPVAFNSAKAYFTFNPARQRIDFSEVSFDARDGTILATGHTYLTEFDGLWPRAYLGQFQVEDVQYIGGENFDGPVALTDIRADLRVRLDPFSIDLGQVVVDNDGTPIAASGRITTGEAGWHVAVDATTERITSRRVLEFWPRRVSPVTRGWLARNLSDGVLEGPALGFRFVSGQEPDVAMSFDFDGGVARFLPDMPRLRQASGRAAMNAHRFVLSLDSADIDVEGGGSVEAGGSVFTVLDTRERPSRGQIDVAASGALADVLNVLNRRPLRLMDRAKRSTDIAEAQLDGEARITLPLKDGIQAEEVGYDVMATLTEVSSDRLVPGRVLTSPELGLTATPEAVAISGPARLDGVPLTANWRQPLGSASVQGGEITGRVTLSAEAVEVFDLPLPEGMLQGEGRADYLLRLPADPEIPPELSLSSNLDGLTMEMDALGWRKPPGELGELEVTARLGDVPEIGELALRTRDLSFEGALDLAEEGQLERARFEGLKLGDWLNAEVEVTPSPNGGAPTITVLGGTMDLRRLELAGREGGGSDAGPINLRLDRLTVSDGIAFAPLVGRIEFGDLGLSGTFEGRVNGNTPVQGVLAPANAGVAIRITSADAAGVLRDTSLTPNARGGTLDLVLTPVSNAPSGTFDGEFLIEDVRMKDAPAMADLLDAISVVGLINQLGGAGIRFDTIDGQFRLNRRQIRLTQAAAVGPSMGISADGIYDLQTEQMDFRGVVSPVYFLNGIGSFLTRRGEGLFGFNYRMAGPAAGPSVGVNPLSILTPGAFRQIFRRAPPGG